MLILGSSLNLSTLGILGLSVSLCNILLLFSVLASENICIVFSAVGCVGNTTWKKCEYFSAAVLIFTDLTYTI